MIKNIQRIDEGPYYFRFETYLDRWRSEAVYLSVDDLIASIKSPVVTEGETVTLTCHSGCHTDNQFVWYREEQKVTQTRFIAMREQAGRYTCALLGQEHVQSSVSLNVQYAPTNVKLSISPSKEVIQGSAVIFTCRSEANPRVTSSGYSLYKDGSVISFGPNHTISEVQPSDSGQYYCQAWNNITRAGSKLFQSFKISVNILYPPTNISISTELTEVIEGSDVNLTCHSIANPSAVGFVWYRTSSSSVVQLGSGPVLSLSPVEASSSGLYMCQASNRLGENNSTQLLLSVKSKYSASSFPILAGIGVSLLFAFVLALLLYWKKQKRNQDESQETSGLSEGDSYSDAINTSDNIYANALMFQTPSSKEDYSSSEEVFYTTVTIRPKKPTCQSHIKTTPEKDSVIYATVAKSS
ncbi:B-cell receptor CD22-like isoform X2 [Boleophthalmus pectinirostris]|uniref:B-cell receptor CD22-like isoform X2 n=1 Tax=Boleophthalmus pectinirostris TaxID=150288 RepID=UPI00242F5AF0|nr:B-cell receptor CD22-like isoform X2 [Boleophthalmus pectinirostris]